MDTARARLAGDTPSTIMRYDGARPGEPTIISTADGNPMAGGDKR